MASALTVLVVDDEPLILRLVRALLEKAGLKAVTVNSASAALIALHEHPADFGLVITDVQMPGVSGLELCKAIHRKYPALPLIAMTGSSGAGLEAEVRQARAAGARTALGKPFDLQEFYDAVTAVQSAAA